MARVAFRNRLAAVAAFMLWSALGMALGSERASSERAPAVTVMWLLSCCVIGKRAGPSPQGLRAAGVLAKPPGGTQGSPRSPPLMCGGAAARAADACCR